MVSPRLNRHVARLLVTPGCPREHPYGSDLRSILGGDRFIRAEREITGWPGYRATPLRRLDGFARLAGLGAVYYKDEGTRFGLGSFKALGGAYAVYRLLAREVAARTGRPEPSAADLAADRGGIQKDITVTCATDGNHGRSVAWGAQMFGCRCVIHVHETVSEGRCTAIARYGAEVRRTPGNYDDAVRKAAADAAANGWHVVSDTSYEGYMDVPRDVMQGYAVMAEETLRQLPAGTLPTHVFVQGGVGGLAAAICGHFWEHLAVARPRFVVVEPDRADCLFRSAEAGRPTAVQGDLDTIMAGLACGEVSLLAWKILEAGTDAFMTIPDEAAADCMRLLADGVDGDPPVVAGESAVAGLAGALGAAQAPEQRAALRLGPDSVVLVFGTEGDTDPDLYRAIVGRPAREVRVD